MLKDFDAEAYIVKQLEGYTDCTMVLSNQSGPVPEYPYLSYTITTPVHALGGTYGLRDGIYMQPMQQTWSITAHGEDSRKCQRLGMRVYDFFARAGRHLLFSRNIAVASFSDLTDRDTYLTIQQEYRCGMDVTFRMLHQLEVAEGSISQMEVCRTKIEKEKL